MEQTFQKEVIMPAQKSRKKLSRIQKILRDFPWLWKINSHWSSKYSVRVREAAVDFLKRKLPTAFGSMLCVKKSGPHQSESLRIINLADFIAPPNSIGELVSSRCVVENETIEYIGIYVDVFNPSGICSTINIYRPPKGTTFNEMLAAGGF